MKLPVTPSVANDMTSAKVVRESLFNGNGLARQLLVAVVLFSTIITTLLTTGELYLRYRQEMSQIEEGFDFITNIYQPTLSEAIWSLDEKQILIQLEGLMRIPNVEHIAIRVGEETAWTRGKVVSQNTLIRSIPLRYGARGAEQTIGMLEVTATQDRIYAQLLQELIHTLIGNAIKTTLVGIFLLIIFQLMVTRHLTHLSSFLARLSLDKAPPVFQLHRRASGRWRPDVLDRLSQDVNRMVGALHREYVGGLLLTAQLQKSEAMYRAIVSEAGVAIVVIDSVTLKVVEVNDTACHLLGYTRDEFLGLHFYDYQAVYAEEDLRRLIPAIQKNGEGHYSTQHRRKTQELIDVEEAIRPVVLDGRSLLIDVWRDVTVEKKTQRALTFARDELRLMAESVPLAIFRVKFKSDDLSQIIYLSPPFVRLTGFSIEEALQDPEKFLERIHPEDRPLFMEKKRAAVLAQSELDCRFRFQRADGRIRWFDCYAEPRTELVHGLVYYGYLEDVTDKQAAQEALMRGASVFTHSQEGIMVTDAQHRITDVNPAFTLITGYTREEVLGQKPSMLSSGRQTPEFYAEMRSQLMEHDFWRGEIWNRRRNGEIYAELLSIAVVRDAQGKIKEYLGVFSDITQYKVHQEELDRIAHYDALTALPNRRLLADRLQLAIARAKRDGTRLMVCFLDLDGFKAINDDLGHDAGDQVLRIVSSGLTRTLRGGDTLARLGGDEFVLLFGEINTEVEYDPLLKRILALLTEPMLVNGAVVQVSASIGVTVYPNDSGDADSLLRHADQAMYRAKELGKNRYHFFDPENDRRISAHREALLELEVALSRREFVLFYQPKINLRTGELIGAEALIRWRKPDGTLVPPGVFLPHLEGETLALRVSEWVIVTALEQMMAYREAGLKLQVSANLIAMHLTQPDFLPWMRALMLKYPQLEAGQFNLEILESAAIEDVDAVAEQLNAVRALGISLSLDDFGTGYSSLAYFRRLPIDILKIDQGFVRDMLVDANDHNIVESVIRLSEVFRRTVIAEGVETVEHWKALLAMGCSYGQGYGIARPMPADQLVAWSQEWRQRGVWKQIGGELT